MTPVRPREGARITVLVEVDGTPATHQARAGRVDSNSMIVPMRREDPRWRPDVGCQALVLFLHDGVLQAWPTRVEEVLPSSYYLTALPEATVPDRRAFVRAELTVALAVERVVQGQGVARLDQPPPPLVSTRVDLSASGMRLRGQPDWQEGDHLALWMARDRVDDASAVPARARLMARGADGRLERAASGQAVVQAVAVVVRRLPDATLDCACEFEHLDSAGEDWLLRLVYEARERELGRRVRPAGSLLH